ncbi:MAG: DUF6435 family protein [Lentisphaeraceae bacterium]|nr:DUF6435 family protein [Lentisphaeraceae bacterium]
MFGFLKGDPVKKAEKKYQAKLTEAMNAQRSGNIQLFAELSAEAEKLLEEVNSLKEKKQS